MRNSFHLARAPKADPSTLPLGTYSMDRFYPTIPYEVFEILVQENGFSIYDETGVKYALNDFLEAINHSFSVSSIQIIPLSYT
ncbi:MAG: hypothetical protein ACFFE8_08610 [Candidatus Heimdallarchaeota archaeon]